MNAGFNGASQGAGFCPGLVTAKFHQTWDFYTEKLEFRTLEESDTCVYLAHASGARLAILREETNEQHPELVSATDGHGFWFQLDVFDIGDLYASLCAVDVAFATDLEAGVGGSRSFTIRDPNGVLIRVVQPAVVVTAAEVLAGATDDGDWRGTAR